MSVFGGDSWAREAQQRKRRVDDLITDGLDSSSYKKLPSGKYACLVCPNSPVLDSSLMLSMHNKGSRHVAANLRHKERELMRQEQLKKRIALSENSIGTSNSSNSDGQFKSSSKPLIEQTRKATSEALFSKVVQQNTTNQQNEGKQSGRYASFFAPNPFPVPKMRLDSSQRVISEPSNSGEQSCVWAEEPPGKMSSQQQPEFQVRRERELKFTSAGWKRDCHGRWFKDENVEFDSDEEDPNVCLT